MKKRWNEVLEYLTTWMNFKNTILSKKKKKKKLQTHQKSMHSILWLRLCEIPSLGKFTETRWTRGWREGQMGMTT